MKNTVISAKFKSAWQKYYNIIIYNTHYKLPVVEDCSLQLPLRSRMKLSAAMKLWPGTRYFRVSESNFMTPDLTALWRVWNKTYDLFCPPQLWSHTTSLEQVSDGSWGALRSLRIAPVTLTAFLSATALCHSPAITGSLS